MTNVATEKKREISTPIRFVVAAIGVASWTTGGISIYEVDNGVGSSTLIVSGAIALLLAGIGRWPNELAWGSGGMRWQKIAEETAAELVEVKKEAEEVAVRSDIFEERVDDLTVGLQIAVEEIESAKPLVDPEAAQKLSGIQSQLSNRYSHERPQGFEERTGEALRRLYPNATLNPNVRFGGNLVDFELDFEDVTIFIEVKYFMSLGNLRAWRRRMPRFLLEFINETSRTSRKRLLFVINIEENGIFQEDLWRTYDPGKVDVVTWYGPEDDVQLMSAIARLTESAH